MIPSLLILGGGVMGRAIIEGSLRAGLLPASAIAVAEPDAQRRDDISRLGVAAYHTPAAAIAATLLREAGANAAPTPILLAVKPQVFPTLQPDLAPLAAAAPRLVLSIMAGVLSTTIQSAIAPHARIVRAMPNTPARIAQGVTGIAAGPGATPGDMALATQLFAALGPVVETIDESLMDAFTAVAGSGPAYLFLLAECMERAATSFGFAPDAGRRVVAQTLRGAAALLDGTEPAALRAAVTSKGGTTAAAIETMQQRAVPDAIVAAITAARDRGRQLSAPASESA